MAKPMASQTTKRIHVITVNPVINPPHRRIEISGNQGTNGTRNPRRRWGSLRRKMMTPRETKTKANSVPMLERSAASLIAKMPEGIPTAKPAIQVDQCGVLKRGCTLENNFGKRQSRDMAYQMRAWPYWKTKSEEIMPISAPTTIMERE